MSDAGPTPVHRPILGAVALAVAGVLFLVYPALRPDDSGLDAAAAFASSGWVLAHLCGVAGFIAAGFGVLALRDALAGYLGGRLAGWALAAWWCGAGLVLTYYGAEIYALNAVGRWMERTKESELIGLVTSIRMSTVPLTVFGVGLALLAVSAVLVAVAVLRSGAMPPGSGLVFALAFLTYLPQFFAPGWLRVVHGAITCVGCLALALQLRRLDLPD